MEKEFLAYPRRDMETDFPPDRVEYLVYACMYTAVDNVIW